ncbi:unnamed protein product [Caretta caretta]
MSLLTNMIYLLLRTAHHFCQNLVQTVRRIQMQTVHSEKGKEREECKHMGEKMKEEGKKLPKKKEKKHPTVSCISQSCAFNCKREEGLEFGKTVRITRAG